MTSILRSLTPPRVLRPLHLQRRRDLAEHGLTAFLVVSPHGLTTLREAHPSGGDKYASMGYPNPAQLQYAIAVSGASFVVRVKSYNSRVDEEDY